MSQIYGSNPAMSSNCGTLRAMGELLGYARVSTTEQELRLRTPALTAAGRSQVGFDTASGYAASDSFST